MITNNDPGTNHNYICVSEDHSDTFIYT